MSRRIASWIGVFLGLALAIGPARAVEELWHFDLISAARSLPLAVDYDSDGRQEVFFTTRFDGTVWTTDANGVLLGRFRRDHWLEGTIAAAPAHEHGGPLFAFQDSAGNLCLADFATGLNLWLNVPGDAAVGTSPCVGDLDGDNVPEIVCTRRNGVVTAVDRNMSVLWQYGADAPFDSSPAIAPAFQDGAAVYAVSVDGVLHCIRGDGLPLWRYAMRRPAPRFPETADPLVVELVLGSPVVLISDAAGTLYAVDAVNGREHWRREAGSAPLGSPAVADVLQNPGREIISVSAKGEIAVLSVSGALLKNATLPKGRYVPRPLVADVDGDGAPELLVPAGQWRIVVASLDGTVKQEIPLQGNVREGLVLADINADGALELLAVTDCARVSCYATAARDGWTHPRGGPTCQGCVLPITPGVLSEEDVKTRSAPSSLRVALSDFLGDVPFSTAVVSLDAKRKKREAVTVLRDGDDILGSAVKSLEYGAFTVPCARYTAGPFDLDLETDDVRGHVLAHYEPAPVTPNTVTPVLLPNREPFVSALAERGGAFAVPDSWTLPQVAGRDRWHVVRYMPDTWRKYGLADMPFIQDAMPRVWAPASDASTLFGPRHEAWNDVAASSMPFFVMNEYFRPQKAYPRNAYRALLDMAHGRFAGFPVHEWAYPVWKEQLEGAKRPPKSREAATKILEKNFKQLMGLTHDRIYAGEGYCLVAHQALAWGAPMTYAEIGENIPCAPLQFAFSRGASRQYGGKPWGAYLSNWFRGAVLDERYAVGKPRIRWNPPEDASGPDCGHSASLEFRLALAAYLSGATFVHHESDAFNGSVFVKEDPASSFTLSEHGHAMKRWFDLAQAFPERGTPFTPVAFLIDFNHGWRPREPIYGIWPLDRADKGYEAMFGHVFPGDGRLDFEQGYLPNGPYGDVFDVLTNDAGPDVLKNYGVVWPVGGVPISGSLRTALMKYVEQGGVLVLDQPLAAKFPTSFLGTRFDKNPTFGAGVQTALQNLPPTTSPFRYHKLNAGKNANALAWTETGDTLAAWRRIGSGLLVVSGAEYWVDENGGLVTLAQALLKTITDAFAPVSISPDLEYIINRTANGYVIGLLNNKGVSKIPTAAAVIDPHEARDAVITFRGRPPLRFVNRLGDFTWNLAANALQTHLAPGDAAVVEAVFGQP